MSDDTDDSDVEVLIIKSTPLLVDLTSDEEIPTITIDDSLFVEDKADSDSDSDSNISSDNSLDINYANDVLNNTSSYDSVLDTDTNIPNTVSTPVRDAFTFSIDKTPQNPSQLNSVQPAIIPALNFQSESAEPSNHEEPKNDKKRKSEASSSPRDFKILKKRKRQIRKSNKVTAERIDREDTSDSVNGHQLDNPETTVVDLCDELDSSINKSTGLKPIVLDGCNIAFSHGSVFEHKREFSAKGIKICTEYFLERGHEVVAVLPIRFKQNCGNEENSMLLKQLEERELLTYIPFRKIFGKAFAVYDDILAVQYAHDKDAVIISNDNFCDVAEQHKEWRKTISERVIPYTFVRDDLIFPYRPLGRDGPTFEEMLRYD